MIKQLFCKHHYKFAARFSDIIDNAYVDIYYCDKCNKFKERIVMRDENNDNPISVTESERCSSDLRNRI